MHEKIMDLARALTSPNQDALPLLEALVGAAEAELGDKLRDGIDAANCEDAFICAAAMTAAARFLTCRNTDGVAQFTVGDVTIRSSAESKTCFADTLLEQAAAMMAPYCRDEQFAFLGVRG